MTGPAADRALLDEAVALARAAGASTTRWFRSSELVIDEKSDGTPVTEADRGAERLIREHLATAHPDDAILGEEEAPKAGTSGRRWIIDPIDGTKAFTQGVPLYSTLVAVEDEHGPLVGVIELPALGETVYAGRGLGCFCNEERVRVSGRTGIDGAYLTTSAYEHWPEDALLAVKRSGLRLRTWGDGYGYALVATGRAEAMVDIVVEPYDIAGMPVILEEAGGAFTDHAGVARIDGGSGLATNGHLHSAVLALLSPGR